MKILITGGLGFQGSHLTEHFLRGGHEVTILNTYSEVSERNSKALKDKAHIIFGSITDPTIVQKSTELYSRKYSRYTQCA
jgi:nucleoside-diphosphate-sugar epimerase